MVKTIYLAAGCFWGSEKYFSLIRGVIGTKVGYANGSTENPTYEDVSYHNSGHAETVEIKYDDSILSLEKLLSLYYEIIDPTSINQQGADRGVQYRTGIYYIDDSDYPIICDSLDALATKFEKPIAIEAGPLFHFYDAEEYHQKYLDKNVNGYCHIGQSAFDKAKNA